MNNIEELNKAALFPEIAQNTANPAKSEQKNQPSKKNKPNDTAGNESLNPTSGLGHNDGADSSGLINRCDKSDLESQISAQPILSTPAQGDPQMQNPETDLTLVPSETPKSKSKPQPVKNNKPTKATAKPKIFDPDTDTLKSTLKELKAFDPNTATDAERAEQLKKVGAYNKKIDEREAKSDEDKKRRRDYAIKKQEEERDKSMAESPRFKALGYNLGVYFLMSMKQLQVLPLKASELNQANLIQLATPEWWLDTFPKFDEPSKVDWTAAASSIINSCEAAGVYAPESIRGRGFWRDSDRVIRHMGNCLVDVATGHEISMLDKSLEGIYQRSGASNIPSAAPATKEQIERFSEMVSTIYWRHGSHADLLMGWIALAALCGILDWRSHIWIVGEPGSGKSDTVAECIGVCVGKKQLVQAKGVTTEPGLRQKLGADATPTVIDEAEPNTDADRKRLDRVVAWARNASSDDEAEVLKGSITGKSVSYNGKSMVAYLSINTHLPELADQSRTTILDIEKRPQTDQSKKDFALIKRTLLKLETENFGYSLTNLMVKRIDILSANLKTFIECAGDMLGQARDGKQYGTLLAGYATMIHDRPVTKDKAIGYLENIHIKDVVSEDRDVEAVGWDECLSKIQSVPLKMRDSKSNVTVGEAIEMLKANDDNELAAIVGKAVSKNPDSNKTALQADIKAGRKELINGLKLLGIIYQSGEEALYKCSGEGIYLANKSQALTKALAGTPFVTWKAFTKRAGETANQGEPIKFSGYSSRAKFMKI